MLLRCQIKNQNIKVIFKKHEYTKWLNKDKNDNTLAFCAVSWKSFSVAADGKKAVVLHVPREFHKSTLPTGSQITVKLVTDKPEEKETIQKVRILLVPEVLVPVPPPLRGILQPKLWQMQKSFGCLIPFPTSRKTLAEMKLNFSLLCSKIAKLHRLYGVGALNVDMLLILGYLLCLNHYWQNIWMMHHFMYAVLKRDRTLLSRKDRWTCMCDIGTICCLHTILE